MHIRLLFLSFDQDAVTEKHGYVSGYVGGRGTEGD
jgi:hypothetical protein